MRILLIIALSLTVGCIAAQPLVPKVTAPNPDAPVVVVLLSSNNRLYDGPVAAFENQVKDSATVYETVVGDQRGLGDSLRDLHPAMVFALGTQAALYARANLPETPLLFAMVVNHRRLKELQAPEVLGIALEVPPLSEFTQFKLALPTMSRILAIYNPDHSSDVIAGATEAARTLGMTLIAAPAHDKDELQAQYKRYSGQFDTVWVLNDPVVMNSKAFAFLREAAMRDHVALVSSLSEQFARAGALMSVSVDFNSLGFQASAMALSLLDGKQKPAEIGVQPPIGARLVLNMVTAQKVGLQIPEEVLPFISEVIVSERASSDLHD
jgi:putative ABC transport system substrate-binding protein